MRARRYDRRTPAAEMKDGRRRVWRTGPDSFKVYGRVGDQYDIPVVNGVPRCPCPAGAHSRKCWHAEKVAERLDREGTLGAAPEPTDAELFGMLAS